MDVGNSNYKQQLSSNFGLLENYAGEIFSITNYVDGTNYSSAKKDLAAYEVPVDKVFKVVGIKCTIAFSGSTFTQATIGYGDNATENSSAPANLVSQEFLVTGATVGVNNYINIEFDVPAGKYPCVGNIAASYQCGFEIYGYLEDA